MGGPIRAIAMYLPQFHPIPENDRWWGEGFTEWTNVRKGTPRFEGHHQPHVPGALGYYDLRDPDVRAAQAALARDHGIHGFCYYHYWFNGKRLLEAPLDEVLRTGEPDFPFCVCWANENWTRRWHGGDTDVLIAQQYGDEDSLAFIQALEATFRDERYIRVDGKPLLLVYRTSLIPDPARTARIWREAMQRAGVGEPYLVRVETGLDGPEPAPDAIGFDAAMEFAPRWSSIGEPMSEIDGRALPPDVRVHDYRLSMRNLLARPRPAYRMFQSVFPSWDNTVRRQTRPTVFVNSSPELYALWLSAVAAQTLRNHEGDERLLFINAWNEWAEGCHLEPDVAHGGAYLEATSRVLRQVAELERLLPARPALLSTDEAAIRSWYCALSEVQAGVGAPSGEAGRFVEAHRNLLAGAGPVDDIIRAKDELIRERDETIAQMERSLSWRITRPLRRVARKLTPSKR
jgi:hypothetical protein